MMMKKLPLLGTILVLLCCVSKVSAQTNFQFHYVVGNHFYKELKSEPTPLVTLEHFSTDKWGQNFFFVDMKMGDKVMNEAYYEMFRNLKFWDEPIFLHLEYNGGLNKDFAFNHAYLAGVAWSYANSRNQSNVSVTMSYRHDQGWEKPHNMQLTTSWGWTSWNKLWTICGFFDLFTQRNEISQSGVVFLAEPQFWLNLNQFVGVHDHFNLSIGSEVKLSYNFVRPDKFYALPTLALKWTFR